MAAETISAGAGDTADTLNTWLGKVRDELYKSVLPFWMDHSIDAEHGGYFDCLDRDGTVFDTTKHVWLQGRQVWMLSKFRNAVSRDVASERSGGKLDADKIREAAIAGASFLRRHARQPAEAEGGERHVAFALTADGRPAQVQRKMFSACFVALGLKEASRIEGLDAELAEDWAKESRSLLDDIIRWADDPTLLGRPVVAGATPLIPLNVPMILLNLIYEMQLQDEEPFAARIKWCTTEIRKHIKDDLKLCLENVAPDGTAVLDFAEGRIHTPGHAIECAWFMLDHAERSGDAEVKAAALDLMEWSFDAGWDKEHGGLYYFLDAKGFSPVPLEWNMKLWWPHCEAMIAFAMAYKATKEHRWLDKFVLVSEYTLAHFADGEHGEWYGYLDRFSNVTHRFKGGPYKGCFHVPRALLFVEEALAAALADADA